MNQKQHHIPGKEATEISTTFKEIKDECWSHHVSGQFLKVLEEDANPHRPHQSQPGSQGCAGGWSLLEQKNRVHRAGMQPSEQTHPFLTRKEGLAITHIQDFPGGPVAQTPCSQCRGPEVQSLDREVDPTCCN